MVHFAGVKGGLFKIIDFYLKHKYISLDQLGHNQVFIKYKCIKIC